MSDKHTECKECGMLTGSNEYHPYGACLMFKACGNSRTVRNNLTDMMLAMQNYDTRTTIKTCSDLALLDELIKRNGISEAPSVTKRHGDWSESLIAIGDDETAHITFLSEAIDNLRGESNGRD